MGGFSPSTLNGPAFTVRWNCYVTRPPIGPLRFSKFKLPTWLDDALRGGVRRGRGLVWVWRFVDRHTDSRAANRGPRRSTRYFLLFVLWPFFRWSEARKWIEMNEHRRLNFRRVSLMEEDTLKGVYRVFSTMFLLTGSKLERPVSVAQRGDWRSRFVICWQPL